MPQYKGIWIVVDKFNRIVQPCKIHEQLNYAKDFMKQHYINPKTHKIKKAVIVWDEEVTKTGTNTTVSEF